MFKANSWTSSFANSQVTENSRQGFAGVCLSSMMQDGELDLGHHTNRNLEGFLSLASLTILVSISTSFVVILSALA